MTEQQKINFERVNVVNIHPPRDTERKPYENDTWEDVNMKIRGQAKEALRQWGTSRNMGMSTVLNKAWELLRAFEDDYETLLAHPNLFKDLAKSIRKNF